MGEVKGQAATLQVEMVCLDELVPEDDRYRRLDRLVGRRSSRVGGAVLRGGGGPALDRSDRAREVDGGGRAGGDRLDAGAFAAGGRVASICAASSATASASGCRYTRRSRTRIPAASSTRPCSSVCSCARSSSASSTAWSRARTSRSTASTPRRTRRWRACARASALAPAPGAEAGDEVEPSEGGAPVPAGQLALEETGRCSAGRGASGAQAGRAAHWADAEAEKLEQDVGLAERSGGEAARQARPAAASGLPRPGGGRCQAACDRRLPGRAGRRFRGRRGRAAGSCPLCLLPELASVGADSGFAAERVWRAAERRGLAAFIPPQPTMLPKAGQEATTEAQRRALTARGRCRTPRPESRLTGSGWPTPRA